MWNRTPLTKLLGIEYPIVQGPFGGSGSSVALTTLVSSSGGLGSFGMQSMGADQIRRTIRDLRSRTSKPFAANLWMPRDEPSAPVAHPADERIHASLKALRPYYEELGMAAPTLSGRPASNLAEQLDAILEARPPVFSFVFGIPSERVLALCRERGITTIGTASSAAEAIALEQAGVDGVVASGYEAGGDKSSFMRPPADSMVGTFALLPQVVDSVRIPVIAAGGIGDARGVAAALALGAHGVQIGTAFLACDESSVDPLHRARMVDGGCRQTTLTRVLSGRMTRTLRNRLVDELDGPFMPVLPYPEQSWLIGTLMRAAAQQGRADLVAVPAGQAVTLAKRRSAGDLMAELVQGTPRVLARLLATDAAG